MILSRPKLPQPEARRVANFDTTLAAETVAALRNVDALAILAASRAHVVLVG